MLFVFLPSLVFAQGDVLGIVATYDETKTYMPGENVPIQIKITGNRADVEQVRLILMSVEDNRPGKKDQYHFQQGGIRPTSVDYGRGYIEGTIDYETYSDHTGLGEHGVKVYACNTSDRGSCPGFGVNDNVVDWQPFPGLVYIGERNGDGDADGDGDGDSDGPGPGDSDGDGNGNGGEKELIPEGRFTHVWDFLAAIVQLLLGLAAIVALGALIVGGYQYTTSSGVPDKAEMAKSTITYAIIGLVLSVGAFLIVQFILSSLGVKESVIFFR